MLPAPQYFTLLQQCCDGTTYLRLGEACALSGECYDGQRPMGAIFWFSWPYRLGLDGNSLVSAQFLLTGLAIFFSAYWLQKRLSRPSRWRWPFLLANCALLYLVVFFPLLRVSLSDLPAAVLVLAGIGLLAGPRSDSYPAWKYAVAGCCLGFAVWIRSFYLYPLLLSLVCGAVYGMYHKSLRRQQAWLLMALLPVAWQYAATFYHTGDLAYIASEKIAQGVEIHMDDPAVGYDVVVRPKKYLRWRSGCGEINGLTTALTAADMASLGCLLKGRIYFYLGSYSARTYPVFDSFENYWGNNPKVMPTAELQYVVRDTRMEGMSANGIRDWSVFLLAIHLLALAFVGIKTFRHRKNITSVDMVVLLLVVSSALEALLIVPEQRFFIVPIVVLWMSCLRLMASSIYGHAACKLA